MNKYIIVRTDGKVQVFRMYGNEGGIPVYEHYRTFLEVAKGPDAFERAADMIRRLEAVV